jgi:hypothetical protein
MMVPFNIQALRNKKKREEFQYLAGNNLTDRDSILPKVFFVFFRISLARPMNVIAALEYKNGGSKKTLMAAHPITHMDN